MGREKDINECEESKMAALAVERNQTIVIKEEKLQEFLTESKKHKVSSETIARGRAFNNKAIPKTK